MACRLNPTRRTAGAATRLAGGCAFPGSGWSGTASELRGGLLASECLGRQLPLTGGQTFDDAAGDELGIDTRGETRCLAGDGTGGEAGLGVRGSGVEHVDAAPAQLAPQRLRRRRQARLDGGVGSHTGDRLVGHDAGDVDEEAAVEVAERLSHHSQRPNEVGGDQLVECSIVEIGQLTETHHPGGVHHTVESPELGRCGVDHVGSMGGHPQVEEDRRHLGSDRPCGTHQPLCVATRQRDPCAVSGQSGGDAPTELT